MDTLGKDQIAEYEFSACLHESFHIQKAENVLNFFLNVTAGQVDNSDF